MANSQQGWQDPQQGWQYPQPPTYPQGPVAPGSMAQPTRPATIRRAVPLMYVGAVLSVAYSLVDGVIAHGAALASSAPTAYNEGFVGGAVFEGLVQIGLWLWMAWKTGTGRSWARVLSTVFFGLLCVQFFVSLAVLAIGKNSGGSAVFIVVLLEWGVGLAALIQLWQRESSEFFTFAKRARLAGAYGAAHYGYQPSGYSQAPQYGQPQYGQPQYGQPQYGQPQYDESSPHDQESQS
jgi:hypothetical protein